MTEQHLDWSRARKLSLTQLSRMCFVGTPWRTDLDHLIGYLPANSEPVTTSVIKLCEQAGKMDALEERLSAATGERRILSFGSSRRVRRLEGELQKAASVLVGAANVYRVYREASACLSTPVIGAGSAPREGVKVETGRVLREDFTVKAVAWALGGEGEARVIEGSESFCYWHKSHGDGPPGHFDTQHRGLVLGRPVDDESEVQPFEAPLSERDCKLLIIRAFLPYARA